MDRRKTLIAVSIILFISGGSFAQDKTIKDLDFLIGKWSVKEINEGQDWWEKATRVGEYILDSTYIQMSTYAVDSNNRERSYIWLIHYNSVAQRFEMVSVYSNWPKVETDFLVWDEGENKLTIRNKPDSNEFHERFGEILFKKDLESYTWKGENKYGDPENPSIWKYLETGKRID